MPPTLNCLIIGLAALPWCAGFVRSWAAGCGGAPRRFRAGFRFKLRDPTTSSTVLLLLSTLSSSHCLPNFCQKFTRRFPVFTKSGVNFINTVYALMMSIIVGLVAMDFCANLLNRLITRPDRVG